MTTPPTTTAAPAHLVCPKLQFDHAGITRTLNKHNMVQAALRAGTLSPQEALLKPWYLRFKDPTGDTTHKLSANDKDAIRAAKDILNGRTEHPSEWIAFRAATKARHGLTIGTLITTWLAAGCPFSKTKPRDPAAASRLQHTLTRCSDWWSSRPVATITHATIEDYVVHRRRHVRHGSRFTGSRSADLELAALSSCCQWAVKTDQIEANPFEEREKFTSEVKHCHESMPANDEQLHQILAWLFALGTPEATGVAAYLAFSALTGLRPGEPALLQYLPAATAYPAHFPSAAPGLVYPLPDGTRRMKVQRLKHGQNPAILITAALQQFLDVWTAWLSSHAPTDQASRPVMLFRGVAQDRVNDLLTKACTALQLPPMKPHGFGRAYYVRVRRSQGADDTTIAVELGQTSNGKLIRDTYGDPMDPVGGNLHDWLPKEGKPAWSKLDN